MRKAASKLSKLVPCFATSYLAASNVAALCPDSLEMQ